jgi:hypothetical protein
MASEILTASKVSLMAKMRLKKKAKFFKKFTDWWLGISAG